MIGSKDYIPNMTTYHIDKNLMDFYLKSLDKRRSKVYIIVTLAIISIQSFIVYKIDNDFPLWVPIIVTAVVSVAFYFSLRLANDTLRQFANGQFYIDNFILKFVASDSLTRQFNMDEIAVIHKVYSGTFVVKGNGWTKFNYIRPKRNNSYQAGSLNVIFIPTITENYGELIKSIKQLARSAMK